MIDKLKQCLGSIDYLFAALVLGVILLNWPYLSPSFVPCHDTMYVFENFYYFYNEYFFHHTIAQWMPYGVYGMTSAEPQVWSLTPAHYFACFTGKLLGITNVLALFKVAVILNQLIFLLGLYLLAKSLFTRKSTVVIVCLASFCSFEWYQQIFLNFKMYDLLPWVLYFLVLFFERRRALFFWMAGIVGVLWIYGCSAYYSVLWLLIMFVMSVILFAHDQHAWKSIWPRRWVDGIVMVFFFIFAASYLVFLKGSFDSVFILGREDNAINSLQTFLTFGGTQVKPDDVITWWMFGWPLHVPSITNRDNTAYAGFLIPILFIWATLFVRNKYFLALLAGIVVLVLMSFGGTFATLVYFFPGMHYFRHIGLVYALVKIMMVIAAGFGWENLMKSSWKSGAIKFSCVVVVCFLLILASPSASSLVLALFSPELWSDFSTSKDIGHILVRLGGYYWAVLIGLGILLITAIVCQLKKKDIPIKFLGQTWVLLLIAVLFLDLVSFQKALYDQSPKLSKEALAGIEAFELSELKFIEQRSLDPKTEHQKNAVALQQATRFRHSGRYESSLSFAQMDNGGANVQIILLNSHVKRLADIKVPRGPVYKRIIGFDAPKIRLVKKAVFFDKEKDLTDYMKTTPELDKAVPLIVPLGTKPSLNATGKEEDSQAEIGTAVVKDFTANEINIEAQVNSPDGAWLVYADAYHPGWHAYINGVSTKIYRAYMAFKAVFVPQGKHEIHLVFFYGLTSILSYVLALIGLIAGAIFYFLILARILFSFDLTSYLSKIFPDR